MPRARTATPIIRRSKLGDGKARAACPLGPFVADVSGSRRERRCPRRQRLGMMAQVIIDKAGNEVVAVVVARLDAQRQRVPDSVRSGTQRLRRAGHP